MIVKTITILTMGQSEKILSLVKMGVRKWENLYVLGISKMILIKREWGKYKRGSDKK